MKYYAIWIWVLMLIPLSVVGQYDIHLRVVGVEATEGEIMVAVYTDKEAFLKSEGVYRSASAGAVKGSTELIIEDLPEGDYALAIFHDTNSNQKMDKNWMGIPKEPLGFSNAKLKTFGPPGFEECRFELQKDHSITIELE
jgi:uncharacterized protein (DUF2141 family)